MGNDHFCDTTKRAYKGGDSNLYHRSGWINPLIPLSPRETWDSCHGTFLGLFLAREPGQADPSIQRIRLILGLSKGTMEPMLIGFQHRLGCVNPFRSKGKHDNPSPQKGSVHGRIGEKSKPDSYWVSLEGVGCHKPNSQSLQLSPSWSKPGLAGDTNCCSG